MRINAPAFACVLGALILLPAVLISAGSLRIAAIVVAWWCTAAAVMLFIDFRRKARIFLRLAATSAARSRPFGRGEPGGSIGTYLHTTICGRCILWAVDSRTSGVRVDQ